MNEVVRAPAVAGTFYPNKREELLLTLMVELNKYDEEQALKPKALVVPHAGYVFSGSTAAAAFKKLQLWRDGYDRVVVLGAAHRAQARDVVFPSSEFFSSPLGVVKVDAAYIKALVRAELGAVDDEAHRFEHSLEVQLPFIQYLLGDVKVVPVLFGAVSLERAVRLLNSVWGDERTLIIVSTDLSHYLAAPEAERVDRQTRRKIALLNPSVAADEACASIALNALLYVAQLKRLRAELTGAAHSGSMGGGMGRVVGYVSATFVPAAADDLLGTVLLRVARAAIASRWQRQEPLLFPKLPQLYEPGASFVTLTQNGKLRGCVGSLNPRADIFHDVQNNAVAAAFEDSRFLSLTELELPDIELEVSLLSAMQKVDFSSRADLLQQLRAGVDGLVIDWRGRRATFLPQVWEQLAQPEVFLEHLMLKAGLPADFWADDVEIMRYTVRKWKESDFGG